MARKALFVTTSSADWAQVWPLAFEATRRCEVHVAIGGAHMMVDYGPTYREVTSDLRDHRIGVHVLRNTGSGSMGHGASLLTAEVSALCTELKPDLTFVHGDRHESVGVALGVVLAGSRLAHIEAGVRTGTAGESLGHAISKLAHLHFVSDDSGRDRLLQIGEHHGSVHVIGSADLDRLLRGTRPLWSEVCHRYNLRSGNKNWKRPIYVDWHASPSRTASQNRRDTFELCEALRALLRQGQHVVATYPDPETHSDVVLSELRKLDGIDSVRLLPSIDRRHWSTLMREAGCVVGNSAACIAAAPAVGTAAVNIGDRQCIDRASSSVRNVPAYQREIRDEIRQSLGRRVLPTHERSDGKAAERFWRILGRASTWEVSAQKRLAEATVAA